MREFSKFIKKQCTLFDADVQFVCSMCHQKSFLVEIIERQIDKSFAKLNLAFRYSKCQKTSPFF